MSKFSTARATMAQVDIVDWAQSKYGFYVDRHFIDGKWILKPSPIRLSNYHARILAHCFTPNEAGRLPYDTIAWCEPAKSGKSALAGLVAEYIALHGEQNSTIVMASNKQNQAASIMFKSLTDSIAYNPHLPNIDTSKYEVGFSNGNVVKAIASNSRGAAGERFSLAVFDELAGYIYQDAERLWNEFKSDPTRQNSIKFCVGYAGYLESKLWLDLLNSGLAGQPVPELTDIANADGMPTCWANGRTFVFWSHVCRQPWQTPQWIDAQRKTLRDSEFRRMILTEFVEGQGDFVDQDAWLDCIDANHKPLSPGSKEVVYIGLDLATSPHGDDCALAAVYSDGDLVKLAFHKIWSGKERNERLKLGESVVPYILNLAQNYNIGAVCYDPYQAIYLSDELSAAGLYTVPIQQTHATRGPRDTALWQMITDRKLVLYDAPDIRTAAAGASAKELVNGLLFLCKSSGRSKIDFMVSLSNCAYEVQQDGGGIFIANVGTWEPDTEAVNLPAARGLDDDIPHAVRLSQRW